MSKTHWIVVLSLSLGLSSAVVTLAQKKAASQNKAAESNAEAARLSTYDKPGGESYFALSLSPNVTPRVVSAHDVVVLIDTSASQTGDFRDKGLAALDSMLAGLSESDRVQLLAVDLNSVPLTDGKFVGAKSKEMAQALSTLRQRVPLGSTDMAAALTEALACYGPAALTDGRGRAVVYIGDGMSTARLIAHGKFGQLVDGFVAARAPISSFAVGPRLDNELLGALANHTGGILAVDSDDVTAAQFGNYLAAAAEAPVIWPKSISLPATLTEVYPKKVPPLRFDRDTVLVGVGKAAEAVNVGVKADVDGKEQELLWNVKPTASNDDQAYLVELVQIAKRNGGVGLPTVGSAGLAEVARVLNADVRELLHMARQAQAVGDLDRVEQFARKAQAIDAGNPEAASLISAATKARAAGDNGPRDLKLVNFQDGKPQDDKAAAKDAGGIEQEGGLLREVEDQQRVLEGVVKAEVQNTLNQARSRMSVDAEGAINLLKLQLENVKKVPEVRPELRAQLVAQIESALQEGQRQAFVQTERDLLRQRLQAEHDSRKRMLQELVLDQQKVEGLIERANALVLEGRFRDAEAAATTARNMAPEVPALTSAVLTMRNIGYTEDMKKVVERRWKGVVDALYQTELSHIPTSDEPPIVYPDAETWIQMTALRKKWKDQISLAKPGSSEKAINDALNTKTECDFAETPLADVIEYFKSRHEIEIQIDTKALMDEAVDSSVPVTRALKGITLKATLRLILGSLNLTYIVKDEVLLITSKTEADAYTPTRVYPVADLVIPIQSSGLSGGLGGGAGGGIGGGSGQGGGGFGGGGQGGGGGGFGGGGGGGLFNVPPQASGRGVRQESGRGFRAMAVKDDLKLSGPKTATVAAPTAAAPPTIAQTTVAPKATAIAPVAAAVLSPSKPAAAAAKPAKVKAIVFRDGVEPQAFWNEHFSKHVEAPEVVRETVRQLMNAKKFAHVVALTEAAMKNRQTQPWMYEMMGLALLAQGRSTADVERALMSAVDFAQGPTHLMFVADYLSRLGLDKRALLVYQQAADLQPTSPEPFVLGLRLAQRLNDLDGIQWATVGVLGQAWPDDQAEIWRNAYRVAAATLETLRAEKRTADADAYKTLLDQALERDVIVRVRWTGDAEVDLVIEEPAGTVCSYRNPRTTSGGVILGDTAAQSDPRNSEGRSEFYVCPKGFDGNYRMLVRRVWGKLATDKVTVEVYTHYMGSQSAPERKQIPLGKDDALVTFELKNGRRTQPLAEQQLANAKAGQAAIGREILAQQLAAVNNPAALSNLLASRGSLANGGVLGGGGGGAINPFFAGGAVGYQPVIITLPEGAMMGVTAVVSHDRRYVRITPTPFFSGVSEVNTFNFVAGTSGTSNGGTGGQGFGGGGGGGGTGGF